MNTYWTRAAGEAQSVTYRETQGAAEIYAWRHLQRIGIIRRQEAEVCQKKVLYILTPPSMVYSLTTEPFSIRAGS